MIQGLVPTTLFLRHPITSSSRPLQIRSSRFKASAYSPLSPQVVPTNSGTSHSVNADSGGHSWINSAVLGAGGLLLQDANVAIRHPAINTRIPVTRSLEPPKSLVTFIA